MTGIIRPLALALVAAAAVSACAPKAPPVAPAAPKYANFLFPGLPEDLAAQSTLATRHMQAWQRLQTGDLRGAERDFHWVTGRSPVYFPSEAGLGYVSLARQDFEQALQHFELSLALSPRYAPALVGRGDALLGLERTADAVTSYEDALSADPSLTDLRARIDGLRFKALEDQIASARKARDAGRIDEAVAAYTRAIASSPDSGFLYRELASVEQRAGKPAEALEHARKAVTLDPSDARAHVIAGEVLESQQQYTQAVVEYEAAAAIEASPEIAARLEAARRRVDLAALPAEYHAIASDPTITRAALAALIGVRLEQLLQSGSQGQAPVMTDTQGSWAAPWIVSVVRAGIMDPFPNHTFQPTALVRRADLAEALSRLLRMASRNKPEVLARWQEDRPKLADLPPSHLVYPAAALTIAAGVLTPLEDDAFAPGRMVNGAEAIQALDRIEALWRSNR